MSDLQCQVSTREKVSEQVIFIQPNCENSSSTMDRDEPEKPILTTDANQTAGHSNSTPLKTKRPSHSDNDCCESHSHQPPLKGQARSGANQEGKSVQINNYTTSDVKLIDTNAVNEFTSAEIALANKLVLESLFSYMNWSDLLRCRIFNKQWQYEATKELRRRKLVIRFLFSGLGNRKNPEAKTVCQHICRVINECKTPSLLSSFQVKTASQYDLSSAQVRGILTALGSQMTNLRLNLNYLNQRHTFEGSSLLTDLQNLLVRQTPNLEFLKIKFDLPSHWNYELQTLDSSSHPPQNKNNALLLLPNLKTFIATGKPPVKFFLDVINAAINLNFLGGVFSSESPTLIKYFMGGEGRDKIHLLKYLKIRLVIGERIRWHEPDFDLLETFLVEHKKNLKLETFVCVFDFMKHNASIAPRIVNAINQLLECSSESLQKLKIEWRVWFNDLLIIPRLPKLKKICFDCILDFYEGAYRYAFIPRGFNMNNSFPNVSSIVFIRFSLFYHFVHIIEITEPVPSVRRIIVVDVSKNSVPLLASDFRHVFPKLVSISYGDEHYSYEI